MEANWEYCLATVLRDEGGNDDDPQDPGGRTSRGIIQREYNAYRARKKLPLKDVWTASDEEIHDIYHTSYWNPWCPQLPSGTDLEYFDMSVNAGPHESTLLLQRALGVNADGHIGQVTLHAIEVADPVKLAKAFSDQKRKFYRSLKTFKRFGKGWMNRVNHVETASLKLIEADPAHRLASHTSGGSPTV